jgi:hypothetical protein
MPQNKIFFKLLFLIILAGSFTLFSSLSFAATTIRVPADQPTIQAGIDAASVGDKIIVENYESEITLDMQIIKGKAVELLSEEVYLNENQKKKKTITLLCTRGERPFSIQSEMAVANEGDGSCPFPSPPIGVEATLVERRNGGVTDQANFYLWAVGGKLYVNIDPVTSSFEVTSWAFDKFYLSQDGFQREVYLVDCIGQMYDDEIVIFTAQTFELKDGPDWSGEPFDPTRILTVGFTAMNGDNYSWDVGTGTPVVIPPVPPGVTPTLVERQLGSEQANFYLWAAGGKLYVNIDPVTSAFEIKMWAFDKFFVTQDGVQREVVLYDCIGQMYDDEIVIFTAQTFELKDGPDWSGEPFDPTRILTVGFTAMNGDNYSWDIIPQCPECVDHPVILRNVTFGDGANCECTDSTSITIGSGVTVVSGAKVIFKAPKINLKSGSRFKNGSEVIMKQE